MILVELTVIGATTAATDFEDVITAGINFTEQYDEVGVAAALTAIVDGDAKDPTAGT